MADQLQVPEQTLKPIRDFANSLSDRSRAARINQICDELSETASEDCRRCGARNPPWSAPSPLWNAVMRGGSINGEEDFGGIVCTACFTILAEQKGIASLFRLSAEKVDVELETVTPSGRVWSDDEWRWLEPEARST